MPKSNLNEILIHKIGILIEGGNFPDSSASHEGISSPTFSRWMVMGEELSNRKDLDYRNLSETQILAMKLYETVTIASARHEANLLAEIMNTAKKQDDGKLLLSVMEKRHRKKWGKSTDINITGSISTNGPVSRDDILRAESEGKDLDQIYKSMISTDGDVRNDQQD